MFGCMRKISFAGVVVSALACSAEGIEAVGEAT